MSRHATSRAYVFLLLFSLALLRSGPAVAAPILSVSPTSLSAQTAAGSNAPPQTVQVANGGNGNLRWSIVGPVPSWLAISPTSGTISGTGSAPVTVNFLTSALAPGGYAPSFQVTSNTGSSVTVSVKLTVSGSTPPPTLVGPQPTITCPADAVDILPGQSIPLIVNSFTGSTTFCLRAGVHSVTSSTRPKTGNTFVGEYGAILDGTGWTTADDTQAAFRAHNEDIDYVTIRNLVIRNMPQHGIQAFYVMADHWTIEYNEIASNKVGLEFAPDFTVRNNYIHHNVGNPSSPNPAERGGGYVAVAAHNTTFDSNEIAYNGPEQKVVQSANVTFRNNFVHHNGGDGIWYDSNNNAGALIDGNRVEDNGRNGISFEASIGATIRNNTLRRNAGDGVFVSMSQNAQISNNSLETNFGGIEYFLNCASLSLGQDVKNNAASNNTVVIGTQSNTYASAFSYTFSSCTSTQVAPYLNGSKNLTFSRNGYRVPSLSFTRYFLWDGWKIWNAWQAKGQDVDGSISQ
jgi:parallel beta-helix repeat protein